MKSFRFNPRVLFGISLLYINIPLCLFWFTWVKWYIAIIAVAVSIVSCFKLMKEICGLKRQEATGCGSLVAVKLPIVLLLIILAVCYGLVSGWGGWMYQAEDWYKHNAVLNDLVTRTWPVFYTDANTPSMLTYYLGAYMVPAAVGKIFGSFRIAEIALFVWAEIGLLLVMAYLLIVVKADTAIKQVGAVLILFIFNGGLGIAHDLFEIMTGNPNYSWQWMVDNFSVLMQYRSNYVCMRWVMPQTLVIWLLLLMWWNNRDHVEHYVVMFLPALFYGAISFLGLIPLLIAEALGVIFNGKKSFLQNVMRLLSLSNILNAFIPGGLLILYYWGNVAAEKPESLGFSIQPIHLMVYACFVIGSVGIYLVLIAKDFKTQMLFWGTTITLVILPMFKMGLYNDLVMCGAIPAMFVLMIYVMHSIFANQNSMRAGILLALIVISASYPLKEMSAIIRMNEPGQLQHQFVWESLEEKSDRYNDEIEEDQRFNYFTYDLDSNIFVKYIAAK